MHNTALRVLYITNGLFVFAGAMLVPLYAIYAENIGATIFLISALATVLLVSKFFATLAIRTLGDTFAQTEYLLIAGMLLRAVSWILLIFIPTIPGLFIVQVIFGVGDGVGSPAFRALFARHLEASQGVRRYSEWELITAASGAIGALAGGYVVTVYGFPVLLAVMATIAIFTAIALLLQPRSLL